MADSTSEYVDAALEGARMEGHAIHGGYFNVPLFSHIEGGLWQGGSPAYAPHLLTKEDGSPRFDKIMCLYPWEPYDIPEGTEVVQHELYDSHDQSLDQIEEIAQQVFDWIEDGNTVLVHCQAGLNRSGIVSGTVLRMMHPEIEGWEILLLMRTQRCSAVLCNDVFAKHVLSWGGSE